MSQIESNGKRKLLWAIGDLAAAGLLIWSIGVKTVGFVSCFFGGVAALLLRPYFKRLEANHVFDFLEHMHPRWVALLYLLLFLAVGFPLCLLVIWLFGEDDAFQLMVGAVSGACIAIMLRRIQARE
jgi:hypothetical protein